MNYILHLSETNPEINIREQITEVFADGDKIIAGLKGSRMVIHKDASTIMINHDFFNMIPSVLKEFAKKLNDKSK